MSTSTRLLSQLAGLRSAATRQLALAICTVVAFSLGLTVTPAGAIVTTVESTKAGLQPRSTTLHAGAEVGGEEPKKFANPTGAPVLPANKTYAVYWDPTDNYHGDWQEVIDRFFQNMGTASGSLASVFAVDAQYTDAANQHADYASTFQGAYTDTDPYPAGGNCSDPHPLAGNTYPWNEPAAITCITNAQIETELKTFIANHKLPTGMGTIFYLLTPPGVTICLDAGGPTGHCSDYAGLPGQEDYEKSFCSYHSDINPGNPANGGPSTILYAAIPWVAGGLADGHIADEVSGYDCQDGGFDPSSKPIEEKEKAKEKNAKEVKEFEEKSVEEKIKQEDAEILAGPHQQEPNQVPCPSPDGYCDTGLADLIISQIGVEQQNIVTDPLLNGWQQQTPLRNESTDECRNFFASAALSGSVTANNETFAGTLSNQTLGEGNYYINDAFNLAALKLPYPGIPCIPGVRLEPKITAPNPINSGEVVGFDGMESDITLNEGTAYTGTTPKETYANYTWTFGDGTPAVTGFAPGAPTLNSPETSPCPTWLTPCAASVFHSYQYGGEYEVTLTVIDTGGNKASVTEPITVIGPARPKEEGPGGPSGSPTSASPGSSTQASTTGTSAKTPGPPPVATAAAVPSSLVKTTRKGLIVRYSVNQQVAGHFEVLLAASIAHRIGLHPPLATGLPAGTPPQVVIGKAILITTKGGRGTIKVQFGKVTGARLRRLGKVSLMLRLNLRNSSGGTTTVLSKFTLR